MVLVDLTVYNSILLLKIVNSQYFRLLSVLLLQLLSCIFYQVSSVAEAFIWILVYLCVVFGCFHASCVNSLVLFLGSKQLVVAKDRASCLHVVSRQQGLFLIEKDYSVLLNSALLPKH